MNPSFYVSANILGSFKLPWLLWLLKWEFSHKKMSILTLSAPGCALALITPTPSIILGLATLYNPSSFHEGVRDTFCSSCSVHRYFPTTKPLLFPLEAAIYIHQTPSTKMIAIPSPDSKEGRGPKSDPGFALTLISIYDLVGAIQDNWAVFRFAAIPRVSTTVLSWNFWLGP